MMEKTYLEIGDNNIFREGVTVNRGTVQENSKTIIGSRNLFMAYVHVAHDCIIEDDVVMVNNSAIAGCVKLEKGSNSSGLVSYINFAILEPTVFLQWVVQSQRMFQHLLR